MKKIFNISGCNTSKVLTKKIDRLNSLNYQFIGTFAHKGLIYNKLYHDSLKQDKKHYRLNIFNVSLIWCNEFKFYYLAIRYKNNNNYTLASLLNTF
jgi:hypothetical protein